MTNKLSPALLARRATTDSTGISTARSGNNTRRVLLATLNVDKQLAPLYFIGQ